MIIRRQQLAAFTEASKRRSQMNVVAFLKQHYTDAAAVPDEELLPPVCRLIRRAESYGLNTEQDMAIYAIAGFLLGESFDKDFPAVQQILPSPVLSSAEKADWLIEWTEQIFLSLQK